MKLFVLPAKASLLVIPASLVTLVLAAGPNAEPKPSDGEPKPPGQPASVVDPDRRGNSPFAASAGSANLDELKTKLHATDEEWLVIGPTLRKVLSARRVAEAGYPTNVANAPRFGFFGGPPPDFPGDRPPWFGDRPPGGTAPRGRRNDPGGPMGPGPFGKDSFDDPGPPRRDGDGPGERRGFFPPPDGDGPDDREALPAFHSPGKSEGETSADGAKQSDKSQADRPTGRAAEHGPRRGNRGPDFRGGPPPFGFDRDNPVVRALNELTTTATEATASPESLAEKIAAVRAARQKARANLKSSEDDLRRLLTPKQEAVLIGAGYLD
jgi:hypothetical protein